ncbi:MAG: 6-bladed beta-propeller [Bacteroidetes bacterium]|nr:6-bladed beta-propeller [Bacteroidota bacterium]
MRKLSIILFLCLLSCAKDREAVVVQYTASTGVELLSTPLFDHVEILTLDGKDAPLLGKVAKMVVKNDIYYIADPHNNKIHLYDVTGTYLNSVGEIGRGPGEYINLSDMIIEENGDICVYSAQPGALYTYSPQGRFLGNIEYLFGTANFGRSNGFNYHYFGNGSGMAYQLYITDERNHVIDSCLTSYNVVNLDANPFSPFGNTLNLSPSYGGEIYRLKDGKINIAYTFDFGTYNIPAAFYDCKDYGESIAFLMSHTIALKNLFFENQKYAIIQASINNWELGWARCMYGLLEKATSTWRWYYLPEGDFMNGSLQYMDDVYIYFTAEPELMNKTNIAERFPALHELCEDCNMVILKCKLATISR